MASSSNTVRGCRGLGVMDSIGSSAKYEPSGMGTGSAVSADRLRPGAHGFNGRRDLVQIGPLEQLAETASETAALGAGGHQAARLAPRRAISSAACR